MWSLEIMCHWWLLFKMLRYRILCFCKFIFFCQYLFYFCLFPYEIKPKTITMQGAKLKKVSLLTINIEKYSALCIVYNTFIEWRASIGFNIFTHLQHCNAPVNILHMHIFTCSFPVLDIHVRQYEAKCTLLA